MTGRSFLHGSIINARSFLWVGKQQKAAPALQRGTWLLLSWAVCAQVQHGVSGAAKDPLGSGKQRKKQKEREKAACRDGPRVFPAV